MPHLFLRHKDHVAGQCIDLAEDAKESECRMDRIESRPHEDDSSKRKALSRKKVNSQPAVPLPPSCYHGHGSRWSNIGLCYESCSHLGVVFADLQFSLFMFRRGM